MSETETFIRSSIQRGGLFKELTLEALTNSGNNRVYRMETPEGTFLVKHYFQHPDDPRDRFAAERAFYSCLWNAGVRRTPEPVQWLIEERLAVFEFIFGEKPRIATPAMVREALDFFREMNAGRQSPDATRLSMASEACFSLREHLDCVGCRVARLDQIEAETEIDRMAAEFVTERLTPAWRKTGGYIASGTSHGELEAKLPETARCISPSDFGFHNSMLTRHGKLRFFDFEYAAWADPAKTVCDFFCQPAVPVDHSHLEEFLGWLLQIFPGPGLEKRVKFLMPLYQVKWCCIILNEFLPTSAARRRFAYSGANEAKRKGEQLARAEKLCSAILTD